MPFWQEEYRSTGKYFFMRRYFIMNTVASGFVGRGWKGMGDPVHEYPNPRKLFKSYCIQDVECTFYPASTMG